MKHILLQPALRARQSQLERSMQVGMPGCTVAARSTRARQSELAQVVVGLCFAQNKNTDLGKQLTNHQHTRSAPGRHVTLAAVCLPWGPMHKRHWVGLSVKPIPSVHLPRQADRCRLPKHQRTANSRD